MDTIALASITALLIAAAVLLVLAMKKRRTAMTEDLDAGRFQEVLDAAAPAGERDRDQLLAIAVAAKHLCDFDAARAALAEILRDDPRDGEAWLELGLVSAYRGDLDTAAKAFDRVGASRSDLLESLTLHRAWTKLRAGDDRGAAVLFSEIEIPLETKLRDDMGEGDPAFAEWFLQAGHLWRSRGDDERARWALGAARDAAPASRLIADLGH